MKLHIQRKQVYRVLWITALCVLSFCAGLWLNGKIRKPDERMLDAAHRVITSDSLYNQQSSRELSYAAIRGMLDTIDDPYAELIEPQAAQNFTDAFTGQTGVIGLYAENKADQVVISIVFPNSAADQAGINVGDVILAIDDVTLDKDSDSSETGLMLRGLPDTIVHLKTLRGDKVLEYDLVRQVRTYVSSRVLSEGSGSDGIGYIAITAFNRTASQQMKEGLTALMAQKPAGLVWDLRNNEGGDMLAAHQILSYFIEDGLLFSAELTNNRRVQFVASGKAIAPNIPLVVLMDKTTYSAAETCAAAVAERGRGMLIGSSSYGKGLIQSTVPLLDDTLLQFTIARWYSPNGEWFQERGVAPQIEVSDDPATQVDELLQAAIQVILQK